jgi:hypothetical protein
MALTYSCTGIFYWQDITLSYIPIVAYEVSVQEAGNIGDKWTSFSL